MKPKLPNLSQAAGIVLACSWLASTTILRAAESLVVCSPDGTHTASVCEQGRISYSSANDNARDYTFYICNPQAIAFSEDGKLLAAAGGRDGSQTFSGHARFCPRPNRFSSRQTAKESYSTALTEP
ncbi:MAG: hypothetical protein ABI651_03110 [Verrucomicrobiota bacterium]